jgi:hypothetical protein
MSQDTTTTAPASTGSTTAPQIISSAAQVLLALIPSLTPYGVVIDLAFSLAEKVAPVVYQEIKTLIATIQDGGTPTAADIAKLRGLLDNLQSPESYFKTPIAEAQAAVSHKSPTAEV